MSDLGVKASTDSCDRYCARAVRTRKVLLLLLLLSLLDETGSSEIFTEITNNGISHDNQLPFISCPVQATRVQKTHEFRAKEDWLVFKSRPCKLPARERCTLHCQDLSGFRGVV
jgi:hypothetical protein